MTELVYVPRKHQKEWADKGWIRVYDENHHDVDHRNGWAVLMAPPGWSNPLEKNDASEEGSVTESDKREHSDGDEGR